MDHWPPQAAAALAQLAAAGRLIVFGDCPPAKSFRGARRAQTPQELRSAIDALVPADVTLDPPSEAIRYRHVIKGNRHFLIFFNEEGETVQTTIGLPGFGQRQWLDPFTGHSTDAAAERPVTFAPHELKLLCVTEDSPGNDRSSGR
jgi:hypothetical protein